MPLPVDPHSAADEDEYCPLVVQHSKLDMHIIIKQTSSHDFKSAIQRLSFVKKYNKFCSSKTIFTNNFYVQIGPQSWGGGVGTISYIGTGGMLYICNLPHHNLVRIIYGFYALYLQ